MPSHLSDLGFDLESEDEFRELAYQAFEKGERLAAESGVYLRWAPGAGVELWGQLDREENLIGLNPHFAGESVMRVGLTARIERPEASPLDGAFHGWASPIGDDPERGEYPFVFDAPDYLLCSSVKLPSIAEVQIAAFAHELSAYESDEAYDASQSGEPKFAAESFIPSGLFTPDLEKVEPPQAYAIMTGRVLETAVRTNPVTGGEFCWARIQTYGGEFDIVADPLLVLGVIVKGGVVHGSFWLSGRLRSSWLTCASAT
jgi:hypothetical protein